MTDQELDEVAQWIATDQSDFAQRCREVLAPSIAELIQEVRRFEILAPRRRKLQPYIRKVWMKRGP